MIVPMLTPSGGTVYVQAPTVVAVNFVSPSSSRIIGPGPGDDAIVTGDVLTVAAMLAPYVTAPFTAPTGRPLVLAPLQVVIVLALTSMSSRVVTTDGAFDVLGDVAAVTASLNAATPPTPGGLTYDTRRRDYSVNGAAVDNFATPGASVMRTSTQRNAAGAYNGGGTGNKATLGHWLNLPLRLDALERIEIAFQWLMPESPMVAFNRYPFVNFNVALQPADPPSAWAVFVVLGISAIEIDGLDIGTWTPEPSSIYRGVWDVNAPDYVQVVNDVGMAAPPAGPVPVPVVQGPPVGVGSWAARAFSLADILVAYPDAEIRNGKQNDGGQPNATPIAGITASLGDSSNLTTNAGRVVTWNLNGGAI